MNKFECVFICVDGVLLPRDQFPRVVGNSAATS